MHRTAHISDFLFPERSERFRNSSNIMKQVTFLLKIDDHQGGPGTTTPHLIFQRVSFRPSYLVLVKVCFRLMLSCFLAVDIY